MKTLRETIRQTTKDFLLRGGKVCGENLSAVGFCANTIPSDIPNHEGILEFPTSDIANSYFATGMVLGGWRVQFICRYQGFMTFNLSAFVNYAAKSKAMWGVPCPAFIRAIGMEGQIGPVATGSHHSTAVRYPGIRVHAPITPKEWLDCWEDFISHDDPMYCSEHRTTYDLTEFDNLWNHENYSSLTLLGVSAGRLSAKEAAKKIGAHYGGISRLKPLVLDEDVELMLDHTKTCVVIDSDYTSCGVSEHICCELGKRFPDVKFYPFGLDDRIAGFAPQCDNVTPSAERIIDFVKDIND